MATNGINVGPETKYLYKVTGTGYDSVYLSKSYAISQAKNALRRKVKRPIAVIQAEIVWGDPIELPEEIMMHNLELLGSGWEEPDTFPQPNQAVEITKVGSKWHATYMGIDFGVGRTKSEISDLVYHQWRTDMETWRELQKGA